MAKELEIKTNIIVVCWNALNYTKLTLNSLFKTTKNKYYLTIIDNGSTDGTVDFLKALIKPENCLEISIIRNIENKGYGGAINQGFEISKKHDTKYTCVCNNDIFFQDGWLKKMEEGLDDDCNLAILGAMRPSFDVFDFRLKKSLKEIVDSTPEWYTPEQELKEITGLLSFEEFCKKITLHNGNNIKYLNCPPESVVTHCALVRNEAILRLGHLADPQFEIYGSEDIDLSWSLYKLGYKVAILNKIYVHHFRHKSIKSSNLDRNIYLAENNKKFVKKWNNELFFFLKNEEVKGVFLEDKFCREDDYDYFFLRKINEKTSFYDEYKKIKEDLYIDEVVIDKPIGNLYRKNHVLILVKDNKGNFVLGQKNNFYADGISRMLGGGLKEDEDPILAAKREMSEETGVEFNQDEFFPIGQIITKANTVDGIMYMKVYLFGLILRKAENLVASDDISGIKKYSEEDLEAMIGKMYKLSGEFRTKDFYFFHGDWGRIYGSIHDLALKKFRKITS